MVRSRNVSVLTVVTQLAEAVGPDRAMAPMLVPPDGGWGWVIVAVGLLSACCVDGVVYCFFLFREPMSKELNISGSDISYLSSLNSGFYFVGAIFGCSVGNHWGFRTTMILGATAASLAYTSGYFLQKMIYYYISVGVIAGIGSGFVGMAATLPAGYYFDKKRSVAMGIVSCGSGLGGLVMPQIVEQVVKRYGWRCGYLFEAGIVTFVLFLGMLIRPLKPVMVIIEVGTSQTNMKIDDSFTDISVFKLPAVVPPDEFSLLSVGRAAESAPATVTIGKMANDQTVVSIKVRSEDPTVASRLRQLTAARESRVLHWSASASVLTNVQITQEPLIRRSLPWYKCGCCRSKTVGLPQRPLMRNDLLYTGDLRRLPEYTETDRDLDYHMRVTRVPTFYQTIQDLTRKYTIWCCYNIFHGLSYLIDYKMFKSLTFLCLCVCGFSMYFSFYLPYVFGKVHLESVGSGSIASKLVSLIGFGNFCGRLLSGFFITACPRLDARSLCSAMTMVSGVSIASVTLHGNLYYKAVCFYTFGFSLGFFVPLRSLIIVDYFGLEKLTSATGVLILSVALGSFLGPPVAENAMRFSNNNRNVPFYLCGLGLVIASLALLPMKKLDRWEKKRAEKKKVGRTQA